MPNSKIFTRKTDWHPLPSVFYNDPEIRETIQHVQDAEHLLEKRGNATKRGRANMKHLIPQSKVRPLY